MCMLRRRFKGEGREKAISYVWVMTAGAVRIEEHSAVWGKKNYVDFHVERVMCISCVD